MATRSLDPKILGERLRDILRRTPIFFTVFAALYSGMGVIAAAGLYTTLLGFVAKDAPLAFTAWWNTIPLLLLGVVFGVWWMLTQTRSNRERDEEREEQRTRDIERIAPIIQANSPFNADDSRRLAAEIANQFTTEPL